MKWALLPSIVLLGVVWRLATKLRLERLRNRIWTGVWVGFVCTAALDALRLTHFRLGLLPGNMPRMFGVLILDQMALGPTLLSDIVGGLYHYWVSACFGLTYTLLVGRTRWWGGLIWGLIIEVGMMTTPPMVVAMGSGYFGLNLGKGLINGVFIGSLYPHIAYGIALGLLLERYTRHQGCFQIDQRRPTERDESDQLLSQVLRMKHQTMSRKFSAAQSEGLAVLADQELVGRAQAGDVCSFEMLVRRHGDRIYRLARRLCDGRTQDAEDSFQNALLKAFRHLAAFRGEAPFSSWLTRIMINECLMHWRQRSRERHWLRLDQRFEAEQKSMPHEVADSSQDLEEVYARREFQRILQQCLAGLPASYRVAFVLHEIDGLSTQETATRMGLSPSGAKSLWRRTRLRVQKFLRKKYCRDDECYWPGASNFPVPRKGQKGKETTCSPSS